MKTPAINIHRENFALGGERRTAKTGPSTPSDNKQLYKAAKQMESLFLYQMLKTMRNTIPGSDQKGMAGMSSGLGKDIYNQMFDQEIARMMAGSGNRSIAGMLYRSLEGTLDKKSNEDISDRNRLHDLFPARRPIKIRDDYHEINSDRSVGRRNHRDRLPGARLDLLARRAAVRHKLPAALLKAVIMAESAGHPGAVSHAGAKGLMQLTDSTAADMGVTDVFDPAQNIDGGARYLRKLLDRFGDLPKALAAYNAGPKTVDDYGGIPPYPETIDYVRNIIDSLKGTELKYLKVND